MRLPEVLALQLAMVSGYEQTLIIHVLKDEAKAKVSENVESSIIKASKIAKSCTLWPKEM